MEAATARAAVPPSISSNGHSAMSRDGFSYWLWRGGTQTRACLEFAQLLHAECSQVRPGALQPETEPVTALAGNTVICAETEEFRQLARTLPCKGWFCVDIGAAHGHATECLATACNDGGPEGGRVIGIEKGRDFYEAARAERPFLDFRKLDALAAPQYLLQIAEGADCVIVDINGVRELEALTPLLALLQRAIRPSLLVVKSRKLHESATRWLASEAARRSDVQRHAHSVVLDADSGDRVAVAGRSTNEMCYDGKCVALQIDAASWWKEILEPRLTIQTRPAVDSAMVADRSQGVGFEKHTDMIVCPNGNPACENATCRNPNCGVGKRASKKKAQQVVQARVTSASSTVQQPAILPGSLRMRSAQRYPLSYPRRYVHTSDGVQESKLRICEFHNYDPSGCRKGAAGDCPLSHQFCHFCGVEGHRAIVCEAQLAADARVLAAMTFVE